MIEGGRKGGGKNGRVMGGQRGKGGGWEKGKLFMGKGGRV
jgi:hypothetical protein